MTYVFGREICGIIGPNTGDCSHETKRSVVVAFANRQGEGRPPVYLTRFFGRDIELELLDRLLADPDERVITLVGPGGVGKTRLLAEAVSRSPLGETIFVDGSALERAEFVLPELVDLLGVDRSADRPSHELLSEHLSGRQMTILFDNLEHLLNVAVDLAALVRALPGLRVIATSRAPMHISGERLVLVEPLDTIGTPVAPASVLPATQLFIDRAALTGKLSKPTEPELATIEEICARLDGLPLAIELAAARLRALSLPALLALLTNQLAVLTGGPVDTSERHRALRATIGWSYDLLAGDEQRLLRELGVFVDSFTLDAARAVCAPGEREIDELLESIYDQALLVRLEDDIDGQPRFRMLTSIRDFAFEQLRESGDEAALRAQHAKWFLDLAESLVPNLHGEGQQVAVARLDRMAPNLRQAFAYLLTEHDRQAALRMAVALQRYWRIRALWDEGRLAFEAAMALGEAKPTPLWAGALRGAAICAELLFDHEAALDLNRRAIAIWEELGDRSGMALSLIDYGNVNNNLGLFDDAIAAFQQAASFASEGLLRTSGVARASMASAMLRKGALEDADRAHREIAPLLRQIDDPSLLSTFLSNQAVARQRLGDVRGAERLLLECLDIQQRLGDEYGISVTLVNLADLQLDPKSTVRYATDALELASRLKAFDVSSAASVNLGDTALADGDVSESAAHFIAAHDGYAAIGDDLGQADVIGLIGALGIESNPVTAARLIGAAQTIYVRNHVQPTSPQAMRVSGLQDPLRTLLGSEAFERERAMGQEWNLDEAVLEALDLARTERARAPAIRVRQPELTFGNLTPRELDVLRLIAAGKSNRQIADALFITLKTADHHVGRILAKLESRNRAGAAALAYQHGLIPTP